MIMLDELRNLKYPGQQKDILFFLRDVIGNRKLSLADVQTICSHAHGAYLLDIDSLISYCRCFGWISIDSSVSLSPMLLESLSCPRLLNDKLVASTIDMLFSSDVFFPGMFSFNADTQRYEFHNELLSLKFSAIRNVLISQALFEVSDGPHRNTFLVAHSYEELVAEQCRKRSRHYTLEQLRKKLEDNAEAGEMAESFVLSYERLRINNMKLNKEIRIISTIDVYAGYDIVSFNTDDSQKYDRFIEVKAISKHNDFYWSSNEIEVARLKGDQYYLYLVNLSQIHQGKYLPQIIRNPAKIIIDSSDWLVEPQSFHVRRT